MHRRDRQARGRIIAGGVMAIPKARSCDVAALVRPRTLGASASTAPRPAQLGVVAGSPAKRRCRNKGMGARGLPPAGPGLRRRPGRAPTSGRRPLDRRTLGIHRPDAAGLANKAPIARRRPIDAIRLARRQFQQRSDNQIAGLEMLASALAISTWERELRGRRARLLSDNTIAGWSFRRGSAKCCDHGAIVHHFWSVIGLLQIDLRIDRVPSSGLAQRSLVDRVLLPRRARRQHFRLAQSGRI